MASTGPASDGDAGEDRRAQEVKPPDVADEDDDRAREVPTRPLVRRHLVCLLARYPSSG